MFKKMFNVQKIIFDAIGEKIGFMKIRRKILHINKNEALKLRFSDVIGDSMSTVHFYYLA